MHRNKSLQRNANIFFLAKSCLTILGCLFCTLLVLYRKHSFFSILWALFTTGTSFHSQKVELDLNNLLQNQ